MALIERFVRDTDNQVSITLTESGTPISGAWTGLDIFIGAGLSEQVTLTRSSDADGVTLATGGTGVLTINPGDLTAEEKTAVDALLLNHKYRVKIVVTTSTNDDGAVFPDEDSRLYFLIHDKPTSS